jgi:hypothetical protein
VPRSGTEPGKNMYDGGGGTASFFGVDIQTTRAVTDALARQWRNSWIGLQMLQLFRDAGLTDLTVEPITITSTSQMSCDGQSALPRSR